MTVISFGYICIKHSIMNTKVDSNGLAFKKNKKKVFKYI